MEPFEVIEPRSGESAVVVEVPHAGLRIDPETLAFTYAPARSIARDADLYVDELCQDAPAEGATLLGHQDVGGVAVNRGLELAPKRAPRAASTQPHPIHWNAQLCEQGKGVFQRVGHALEHRPHQMAARMAGGEPDKRRPCLRIEVRRPLAQQVGRPKQPVAAGRNLGRQRRQRVVALARSDRVPQPAQR